MWLLQFVALAIGGIYSEWTGSGLIVSVLYSSWKSCMDESSWTANYFQWLDAYMRSNRSVHNLPSPPTGCQGSNNLQAMAASQQQGQAMGSSSYEGTWPTMANCSQPASTHLPASHFSNNQLPATLRSTFESWNCLPEC